MLFFDTVTILEPSTSTSPDTNEPLPDWSKAPIEHVVDAELQPLTSTEAVLTAGTVISRWALWLDPSAALESSWRVSYDGSTFEVDGRVDKWKVDGVIDHQYALLKLVQG